MVMKNSDEVGYFRKKFIKAENYNLEFWRLFPGKENVPFFPNTKSLQI